jgi:hypothetical protein
MTRLLAFTVVLAAASFGCAGHLHRSESYGRSNTAAFAVQSPAPKEKITGPVSGLDSQEAAIIARSYRGSLVPKVPVRTQYGDQPVLVVSPQAGDSGPRLPPPSVPRQ